MTTPGSTYIDCSGLFKIYKAADLEVVALRGLELTVKKCEIMATVGASGSVTSTLLNNFAVSDAPSAGRARSTAASISCAVSTATICGPTGSGAVAGPLTSTTSAPSACSAAAIAAPCAPAERLAR